MRSVECLDAVVVVAASRVALAVFGLLPLLDSGQPVLQVSGPAQADSDLARAFVPLAQLRVPVDLRHSLLQTAHSRRGHLFPATTISSGSIVGLDFTISIIIISVFLTAASDASRRSLAPDYFGARPTILLTMVAIIQTTMERRRLNLLS